MTDLSSSEAAPVVEAPIGAPLLILRLEGLALLALATCAFAWTGKSWWLYGLLFFTPDISFAAYLAGPRLGAAAYNLLHATIVPALLAVYAIFFGGMTMLAITATWLAHIGFDRAMGYGLKYADSFHRTHLGPIGPLRRAMKATP
jgi:hypothetical protein